MCFFDQNSQIFIDSKMRIYFIVIRRIVFMIWRRRKHRVQINTFYSKLCQIAKRFSDSIQISAHKVGSCRFTSPRHTILRRIRRISFAEALWKYLIVNRSLTPFGWHILYSTLIGICIFEKPESGHFSTVPHALYQRVSPFFPSLENNIEDISPAFEKKPLPYIQPMFLNGTALTFFLLSLFLLCDSYENKPTYTFLCPHSLPGKKISDETDPVHKFPGTSRCDKSSQIHTNSFPKVSVPGIHVAEAWYESSSFLQDLHASKDPWHWQLCTITLV